MRKGQHVSELTRERMRTAASTPEAIARIKKTHTGRKHSVEQNEHIATGNRGKKRTGQALENIKKAAKECQNRPEVIELKRRNQTGKSLTDKTKQKMSEKHRGKKFSEEHLEHLAVARSNAIFQDTSIEIRLHEILLELQTELYFQVKSQFVVGRYLVDRAIVFNDRVICVEAYGCYWHDYDRRNQSVFSETILRDIERETIIAKKHTLVILWENDLSNEELCKNILLDAIASSKKILLNSASWRHK